MSDKDTLFEIQIREPGDFVFDDRVVTVFPDMIKRWVPGYGLIIPMIGLLARRHVQPDSTIYDLGCSLGAATLAMRHAVNQQGVRIVAVDNSPAMISCLRDIVAEDTAAIPVEAIEGDICDARIENASVVVLNFTLQFIDPDQRLGLLRTIVSGMKPRGVLILSEKMRFDDPREQELHTAWHHDFKRAQGYSDLEIAQKRNALENVMKPDSESEHRERLCAAGFSAAYRWFQGFNFVSLIAFK
jgi:tRNA (cmo5U34)-methyltransferase